MAITGEINLQGDITEVGGIESKVTGGIKAGITTFFYPFENEKDIHNVKVKLWGEPSSPEENFTFSTICPEKNIFGTDDTSTKNVNFYTLRSDEEIKYINKIKFIPIKNINELLSLVV